MTLLDNFIESNDHVDRNNRGSSSTRRGRRGRGAPRQVSSRPRQSKRGGRGRSSARGRGSCKIPGALMRYARVSEDGDSTAASDNNPLNLSDPATEDSDLQQDHSNLAPNALEDNEIHANESGKSFSQVQRSETLVNRHLPVFIPPVRLRHGGTPSSVADRTTDSRLQRSNDIRSIGSDNNRSIRYENNRSIESSSPETLTPENSNHESPDTYATGGKFV